jgi:hypothetical protein
MLMEEVNLFKSIKNQNNEKNNHTDLNPGQFNYSPGTTVTNLLFL